VNAVSSHASQSKAWLSEIAICVSSVSSVATKELISEVTSEWDEVDRVVQDVNNAIGKFGSGLLI
jgi:hypothetical protein